MSDLNQAAEALPLQPEDNGHTALVGKTGRPVSVQLIQEIFKEITGKTENLTQSFNKSYQIEFNHITDLYHKLEQTLEQFNVISQNFSAIIYYVNNMKDELGSFERLAFHNAGASNQVESIFLKYDFLIIPSKSQKTQSYTITIRIASSVAVRKRFEAEGAMGPPAIFRLMRDRTAYSKIEYIDYTVAKTMQNVINDWFSLLPRANEQKIMRILQNNSYKFPRIFRYISVILSSVFCLQEISKYMPQHGLDMTYFSQLVLGSFMLIYSAYVISSWIGEYSESSLDKWSPISYLKFNKADELEIDRLVSTNRKSLVRSILTAIMSVSTSVAVKGLASIIFPQIFVKHP